MNPMSVLEPYQKARALLGVSSKASPSEVKTAYRKLVIEHPPDTDPQKFQQLRDAYELLTDGGARAKQILLRPLPAIDPPALSEQGDVATRGATAIAVLRTIASRIDLDVLLDDTPVSGARRP
jgi:curved DNA-binding protein CbpA